MSGAELLLAIEGCIIATTPVVVKIIKTAAEVIHHKQNCINLSTEAKRLQNLLIEKKTSLRSLVIVKELEKLIHDILDFVVGAKTWTILGAALDTLWKHRYQKYMRKVARIKHELMFEASIINTAGITDLRQGQKRIATIVDSIGKRLDESLSVKDARQVISYLPWSRVPEELEIKDLQKVEINDIHSSAVIEGVGQVALRLLVTTNATTRYLQIYRDIQAAAYVETFHGVYQMSEAVYAVLEDISAAPTLAKVLNGSLLPEHAGDRLRLCCDLAQSVAWFHQNHVQVKTLSDTAIILKEDDKKITRPLLIGLESSRLFLERTSSVIYDIRYEAPEYMIQGKHTRYSDVWSLGVVLWQLYTGGFPFNIKEPILGDCAEATIIREHLANGNLPGNLDKIDSSAVASLIRGCWSHKPTTRTSALEIYASMMDIFLEHVQPQFTPESKNVVEGKEIQKDEAKQDLDSHQTNSHPMLPTEREHFEATMSDHVNTARLQYSSSEEEDEEEDQKEQEEKETDASRTLLERVSLLDFQRYVHTGAWTGTKYFLIGATILWELVEDISELLEASESYPIVGLPRSRKEHISRLALSYLETAIDQGYNEAFHESFIAHATIAREMMQKAKAWLPAGAVNQAEAADGEQGLGLIEVKKL